SSINSAREAGQPGTGRRRGEAMTRARLFVAFTVVAMAAAAHAQDWPQRPVRIVVPFAAGSSPDILARIVNDKLAARVGQPLIVENKPGAGGNSGTDMVSKAQPD